MQLRAVPSSPDTAFRRTAPHSRRASARNSRDCLIFMPPPRAFPDSFRMFIKFAKTWSCTPSWRGPKSHNARPTNTSGLRTDVARSPCYPGEQQASRVRILANGGAAAADGELTIGLATTRVPPSRTSELRLDGACRECVAVCRKLKCLECAESVVWEH